jgi:signal transduction histidine kinase
MLVGTSVLRQFKDGRFIPFGRDADFKGSAIYAIHQDRGGVYWVGASNGLYRIDGETTTALTTADGLPDNTVQAIKEDRTGRLWFGTLGGLCVRDPDGKFRSFTERDGLASDHVRTIHEDADGVMWIGTYDGGISRFADGKFTNYTVQNGLFNNGAFQILEDGRGNFWMSCNKGIYRTSRSEMNEVAAGRRASITSISYGRSDGMLSIECNGGKQPAGLRARDGRLWFPTQRGVAIVDPSLVETNPLPPPVVIEEGIIDGKTVSPRAGGDGVLYVLPGQGGLEIRYTGLSFITPENVQFRYRLAGLDENWVDAGPRRAAFYQYLPPGEYTFQVIAANRDGVWNTVGAQLRIIVQPPFWRTWWFTLLVAAACLALAYLVYRRRVSKLERARVEQAAFSERLIESQEGERKRIAAELHDGLGQNLLVIKNRAMLSLSTPENKERAIEQLDEISSIVSQTIDEVREIAHNLRPFQLDRLGLTKALQSIIRKMRDSSDIRFTAEIEPIDDLFSKEAEINLYRIVQESLNNIVKHSNATAASLSVKRDARGVVIRVEDNGKGFDRAAHPVGGKNGFGLTSISERARILGGKETIRSAPQEGTTILLEIALPNGSGVRGNDEH